MYTYVHNLQRVCHPDWLAVLENLRYIRDHPEGPSERYSRPCKLQQMA